MAKIEARKAFDKAQVDGFTKSLKEGRTAAEALHDQLEATGKIEAPNIASWANPFADATSDVTQHVANLGLTLDQFNALVEDYATNAGAAGSLTKEWGAAQREAGASGEDMVAVMNAIATAAGNLNKAEDAQAANAKVFGDTAKQVNLFNDATDEMRNKLVGADKAAGGLAVRLGTAAGKTAALESAYQSLSDQVSNDQAMLDLADQIDAVTDAGNAAIQAQKDANAAIKQNASDATEKQREAEAAMRDYQSAVNATKQDIINLAASAGANPVELKTALDKVDQGDLNGAKADAEAWSRRNPVVLTAELRVALIKALGSGLGPAIIVPGSASAPTTTVNNFLAAPVAAREVARAQGRRARINGR
jgi:predicted  nucleic acid-binding Zn-ribbon protein